MPTDPKAKVKKRGRPVALNTDWLRQRRDRLKSIFESYWPQVGWDLCRATTPESVMQALRPLEILQEPRIDLLLTDLSGIKRLEDVRRYEVQRQRLSDDLQIVSKRLHRERQLVSEAQNKCFEIRNWLATSKNKNHRANHRKREASARLRVLKQLNVEVDNDLDGKIANLNHVSEEYKAAEAELVALNAARVQKEFLGLLLSIRRSPNPLNLANALAGLPEIGWRRSFDLCKEMNPNPEEPASMPYSAFGLIEEALRKSPKDSPEHAINRLRARVFAVRNKPDDTSEYLKAHWHVLESSIMEVWKSCVDSDKRPFVVTRAFFEGLRKPVSNPNPLLEEMGKCLNETRGRKKPATRARA
jgi:hypothetical protein